MTEDLEDVVSHQRQANNACKQKQMAHTMDTRLQYERRSRTWSLMRGCASWAMIPHVANLPTGFSMNHDGAFDQ